MSRESWENSNRDYYYNAILGVSDIDDNGLYPGQTLESLESDTK